MRKSIIAAAALAVAAPLAVSTPAHAATGKMTYGEYTKVDPGDSLASVGAMCGCSGDQSKRGGDLWVFYTADNSTFSANVDQALVVYSWSANAGRWQAASKARCGDSYAGCRFDW